MSRTIALAAAVALSLSSTASAATRVYVSVAGEKRIAVYDFDPSSGELRHRSNAMTEGEPGALCVDPARRRLFAALRSTGQLAAFQIDAATGGLTHINTVQAGADPAQISTDRTGRYLLTAYYVAAKATVHTIGEDGALSAAPLQSVPTADKAHAIATDPTNRFAFVPHTGSNAIFQFTFDAQSGLLAANDPPRLDTPPDSGPRHIAFHPTLDVVYIDNEQGSSVTAYALQSPSGTLTPVSTAPTIPDDYTEVNSTAEIRVHPTGRFLYVSNRGHDSIACFALDEDGQPTPLGQAPTEQTPRSFDLSPDGNYLYAAGESSGELAAYRVDLLGGTLERIATYDIGLQPWWVMAVESPTIAAAEAPSIDIGTRKQLLVDDYAIAVAEGVVPRLGAVHKANDGRPIFTDGWFYGTVLYDEGRFKLWFRKPGTQGFGYAESDDGLQFEKRAELTGINFAGDYTLAVEIDPLASDADHRFIAGYDAPGMAAGVAHSADGIAWTPYNDGLPVTGRAADTYNQVLRDPLTGGWRLFTRTDFGSAGGGGEVRGTRSMFLRDLQADPTAWQLVREWKFDRDGDAEPARRQVYALTCWIYEGVYFALISVYEHPGDTSEGTATDRRTRHERDVMNVYLATSRDADRWDLRWVYAGQPLIPRGPDDAFDKDLIVPASTIVTHDDRHWIYYAGADERHGNESVRFDRRHAIGLATLRLDGFVGLVAAERPGTITTRPFPLAGDDVELNLDAAKGECRVEVLDAAGRPLPGFTAADSLPLTVDGLRQRPRWREQTSLAAVRGQTVRLRFRLRDATLYAFQVRDSARP